MGKILEAKAGKLSIMDAFLIAGTKTFSERFLTSYVGNGTVFSGGVKLVGAMLVNSMIGGKTSDILATALTVDGTEDVVNSLLGNGGGLLKMGNRTNEVVVM